MLSECCMYACSVADAHVAGREQHSTIRDGADDLDARSLEQNRWAGSFTGVGHWPTGSGELRV